MESFDAWFARSCDSTEPWLILGKGPTFARLEEFDLDGYRLLGLNHVGRDLRLDVAHAIDLDVIERFGEEIASNAAFLVMPWHPHVGNRASENTLSDFAAESPVLAALESEGRLLFYNHALADDHHPDAPVIDVRYFSAEAALNLLAEAGVGKVRSLGVDGGAQYADSFRDLSEETLLANGRKSFDRQFEEFARTIARTGVDFAPLDVQAPVRIFVATTEEQMLAVKVLEFSIRKHASLSTEVVPLHRVGIDVPVPREESNRPRTPFSFQRYLIPEACDYSGRAIYLDSDMLVFRDVRKLWAKSFGGANLLAAREPGETGRRPQFSVMLLDCARLPWQIGDLVQRLDSGELDYASLVYEMKVADSVSAAIEPEWNSLECFDEASTCLLHYTDMDTQPWVSVRNPLAYLWFRVLFEALDEGFVTRDELQEQVDAGWIRPSLLHQVDHRIDDPLLLPAEARGMDDSFVAPYQSIHAHGARAWRSPVHLARAIVRRVVDRSPYARIRARLRDRA